MSAMMKNRVLFVTGASRGIGLAIALRAARDGARIAIAAKTAEPHPRLPGTIYTAAEQIRQAGGEALPIQCDIRFADQVEAAVAETVAAFGGIDVCVNNASAISLTKTLETPVKTFDLMHQINFRGAWFTSRACLPHLLRAGTPHILNISPPLDVAARWFGLHGAYTIAKYNMSLVALGLGGEVSGPGAVDGLWAETVVGTSAIRNLGGEDLIRHCRKPEIMADAAYAILTKGLEFTGNFLIDEQVLRGAGVDDFSHYACSPGEPLHQDLFLDTPRD